MHGESLPEAGGAENPKHRRRVLQQEIVHHKYNGGRQSGGYYVLFLIQRDWMAVDKV